MSFIVSGSYSDFVLKTLYWKLFFFLFFIVLYVPQLFSLVGAFLWKINNTNCRAPRLQWKQSRPYSVSQHQQGPQITQRCLLLQCTVTHSESSACGALTENHPSRLMHSGVGEGLARMGEKSSSKLKQGNVTLVQSHKTWLHCAY